MKFKILLYLLFFLSIFSCKSYYYEKEIKLGGSLTNNEKIDIASKVVPSKKQYEWQKLELTAFIHFGINTFTGNEWGSGREDPNDFFPTEFDAEQWVRTLKECGFNLLLLTAKHHDGFCLWQTKTTEHSLANSKWKSGTGDVVKEVASACEKYRMKFGFYLSPWDRNAHSYGKGKEYDDFFIAQLCELLSDYGAIAEVWFDGANGEGENGKIQNYNWERYYAIIDSIQPNAVKAIMGNDVRWVGNEKGYGRETEWSVTPFMSPFNNEIVEQNKNLNILETSLDLGSRKLIYNAKYIYWFPSEVDVSIRPGWFYHESEDTLVKPLNKLIEIYFNSVGLNSVLLLNIPPDKRGLINNHDVKALKEFNKFIKKSFEKNLIAKKTNFYFSNDNSIILEFIDKKVKINTILLQEDIMKGQRIEEFEIDGFVNNKWINLATATTIGYKRLIRFDNVEVEKLKIKIKKSRNRPYVSNIQAFNVLPINDNVK